MLPGSALRPARPQPPQDAAPARCRITSHGLSLHLERGGGVSAGLLHFPAGNAARSRHQAHQISEAGPGASSAAAARWPAPGARASRTRPRVVVPGKRPKPKLRGSFPAGGIATPAAQQASARCSSAADTPAAASRRRIVTRRRTARRGPARRSGARRSEPPRHIVPRRTTRDISRRHPCPQPHRPGCLMTSSSRTGLPGPATSACRPEPRWRGRARRSRARAWRSIGGSTPLRWWRAGPARRGARAAEGQLPAPALIAASSLALAGREPGRLGNPGLPGHRPAKGRNRYGEQEPRPVRPKKILKHVRHVTVVADRSRR